MLENLISSLLQDIATKYLDNFDSKMLSISLLKGDIEVRDLSLKAAALQGIHPALKVLNGFISAVKIQLSYTKLKSVPVIVEIEDILVLASPEAEFEMTRENIERHAREQLASKVKLALQNELLNEEALRNSEKGEKSGFVTSLVTAIVNNLIVKINNIHVRVEDTKQNFCFGLTIREIEAKTVKLVRQNGVVKQIDYFVQEGEKSFVKKIELQALALYADNGFIPLQQCKDKKAIKQFLKDSITDCESDRFNYIIQPISMKLICQVNSTQPGKSFLGPKIIVNAEFDIINLNLSMQQLSCMLNQAQQFERKSDVGLVEYRPDYQFSINWWAYLLSEAEDTEYNNKLMYPVYIKLFSKHYIEKNLLSKKDLETFTKEPVYELPDQERDVLNILDREFSLKEISFCRTVVINELFNANFKQLLKKNYCIEVSPEKVDEFITEANEKPKEEVLPDNFTIFSLDLKIDMILLMLNTADEQTQIKQEKQLPLPIGEQYSQKELTGISLTSLFVSFSAESGDKLRGKCAIADFQLLDLYTQNDHNVVIRPLPSDSEKIVQFLQGNGYYDENKDNFIEFQFEKPGENGKTLSIKLNIEPIMVTFTLYVVKLLLKIGADAQILSDEEKNNYILQYMANNISDEFSKIQNYSKNAIELAIKNHITFDLEMIISAPVVIVPSAKLKDNYLVINMGRFLINSAEVDNSEIYDNYELVLQNMCIFTVNSNDEFIAMFSNINSLSNENHENMSLKNVILYPFNVGLVLKYCYLPNYLMAEKLYVKAHMQELVFNINNSNTSIILLMVEKIEEILENKQQPVKVKIESEDIDLNKQILEQLGENQESSAAETSETSETSHGFTSEFKETISMEQIAQYVLQHFELQFDKLEIIISVVENNASRRLLSAQLRQMSCSFIAHPYSSEVNAGIELFAFEDAVSNVNIMHSVEDNKLFEMQLMQLKKKDPRYQNCDVVIGCVIGAVAIHYYPQVVALVELIINVALADVLKFDTSSSAINVKSKNVEIDSKLSDKFVNVLFQKIRQRETFLENHYKLKIKLQTNKFSLLLSNSKEDLCSVNLLESIIEFSELDRQQDISIECDGLTVIDMYESTKQKNIVSFIASENNKINIDLRTFEAKSPDFCGYETEICIEISVQMQILIMMRFIESMLEFANNQLQNFSMLDVDISSSDSVAQAATQKAPSLMKIDLFILAPKIILPLNEESDKFLCLDLGELSVHSNEKIGSCTNDDLRLPLSGFDISLSNLTVFSSERESIIEPLSIAVNCKLAIDCEDTKEAVTKGLHPETYVDVLFDKQLNITLLKEDFEFIMQFLWRDNNLGFNIDELVYADDSELNRLRQLLKYYEERNNLTAAKVEDQQELTIEEQIKSIQDRSINVNFEELICLIDAQEQVQKEMSKEDQVNIGYSMKLNVEFLGINAELLKENDPRIEFLMGKVTVSMKMKDEQEEINLDIFSMEINDEYLVKQCPNHSAIMEIDKPLQIVVLLSKESNKITMESDSIIAIEFLPDPLKFLLEFIQIESEHITPEMKKHEKELEKMKSKCEKLEKYITQEKRILAIIKQNEAKSDQENQLLLKISRNSMKTLLMLHNEQTTELSIKLPTLTISVPYDIYQQDSEEMEILLGIGLEGKLFDSLTENSTIENKILFHKNISVEDVVLKVNQFNIKYYYSLDRFTDILPIFEFELLLSRQESDILFSSSLNFIRRNINMALKVLMAKQLLFHCTHNQLAFVMKMVQLVLELFESAPVIAEEPDSSLFSSEFSSSSDLLSLDEYEGSAMKIENCADEFLFDSQIVSPFSKFEEFLSLDEQDFPVFTNSDNMSMKLLADKDLIIRLSNDKFGLLPIVQLTLNQLELLGTLQSIYEVRNKSKMGFTLNGNINVENYNINQKQYENIISDMRIQVKINDFPKKNDQSTEIANLEHIDCEIENLEINFSPTIFYEIEQISDFAEEFLASNENEESIYYSPYPPARKQIKKQISTRNQICNRSGYEVHLANGQTIQPYQSLAYDLAEAQAEVVFTIAGQESSIEIRDKEVRVITAGQEDIYVICQFESVAYTFTVRQKYLLRNATRLPIALECAGGAQFSEGWATSPRGAFTLKLGECVSEYDAAPVAAHGAAPGAERPAASLRLGEHFLRAFSTNWAAGDVDFADVSLCPVLLLHNACVDDLLVCGAVVQPLQSVELFMNPEHDLSLASLQYAGFCARNFVVGARLQRPPGLSDSSDAARLLREEAKTSPYIYQYASSADLRSASASYELGIHRRYCASAQPLTNCRVTVFPHYIVRNCYALQRYCEASQLIVRAGQKSARRFEYRAGNGEFAQLGIARGESADFAVQINEQEYALASSVCLEKQLATLTQDDTPRTKPFYHVLRFEMAANGLSKVITLFPGRIIRNNTAKTLKYCLNAVPLDAANLKYELVEPGQASIVQSQFAFLYLQNDGRLSSAFDAREIQSQVLQLPGHAEDGAIAVQTSREDNILVIDLFDAGERKTVEIRNLSQVELEVRQQLKLDGLIQSGKIPAPSIAQSTSYTLAPQETICINLDDVAIPPFLSIAYKGEQFDMALIKFGKRRPKTLSNQLFFTELDVRADKRIVTIKNQPITTDTMIQKAQRQFDPAQVEEEISLNVKQLSLSIYDYNQKLKPFEILRAEIADITAEIYELPDSQAINASIRTILLLNPQKKAEYATVLEMGSENSASVLLNMEKIKSAPEFSGIVLKLSPMDVNVDENLLQAAIGYTEKLVPQSATQEDQAYDVRDVNSVLLSKLLPALHNPPPHELDLSQTFIGVFYLSAVQIELNTSICDLSFVSSNFFFSLVSAFGTAFTHLQGASLGFSDFCERAVFACNSRIADSLIGHYKAQIGKNVFQVLKSASFVGAMGSSGKLLQSSGEDVFAGDSFAQRMRGVAGIGRSLVAGYGGAINGVAGTFSGVLGALSFDQAYVQREQRRLKESRRGAGKAMQNAGKAAGMGILDGIAGIVQQPINGAKQEGALGAFKGIGRGIAGLFTKPVAGLASAVSNIGVAIEVGSKGAEIERKVTQKTWDSGLIGKK